MLCEALLVIAALERARALSPFPLRGVDFDNDGLFMNETVLGWCWREGLEVTRSRAYRKYDQARAEQKNGATVRRLAGYGRFEGALAGESLNRLFAAARLHGNLLQPSFKLRQKRREEARVRATLASADPVLLLAENRAARHELGRRVDERGTRAARAVTPAPIDLAQFTANLEVAWASGERQPTRRRRYVHRKLTKRATILDDVKEQILAWLEAQPSSPAIEVL